MYPYSVLIVSVIAIIFSAFTFVYQRYNQFTSGVLQKQKHINELREQISDLTKAGNTDKVMELQKEMMGISIDVMKSTFKNMLWIMVFGLFLFVLVARYINEPFPVSTFLGIAPVFVWYILISLISNILFKIIFSVLEKKGILSNEY